MRAHRLTLSASVLVLGLAAAVVGALLQNHANDRQSAAELDAIATRMASQITERLSRYGLGLRGVRGAIESVGLESLDRQRFQRYHQSLDPDTEFPGARGFGFIRRVPRAGETAFLQAARNAGFANFSITQLTPHDGERYIIQYIEPGARNQQAIGLDIASESRRRDAADRATLSGEVAITRPITLVQATGHREQAFLILAPLYQPGLPLQTAAQRVAASQGWTYAPLLISEVLQGIAPDHAEVSLAIYDQPSADGVAERFYGAPASVSLSDSPLVRRKTQAIFGRTWQIEVQAQPALYARLSPLHPLVVFSAIALTAILGAGLLHLRLLSMEGGRQMRDDRERLAVALRDSEALLHTIKSHSLYSVADRTGAIIDVNDGFCEVSGYTREALLGQNHRLLNSGIHDAEFWRDLWQCLSAGIVWRGEICNRAKDGSHYWLDSIIAPFYGSKGSIERYVSIRTDITARKRATMELSAQRTRLAQIIEATRAGTWEWNIQTGELLLNAQWTGLLGYAPGELALRKIHALLDRMHPDDRGASRELLTQHVEGQAAFYEHEHRYQHRDGHWVWVLDRGRVSTRTHDGRPEWMHGTTQDISRRKDVQIRLAKNEDFLARVGQIAGVSGWQLDLVTGDMSWPSGARNRLDASDDGVGSDPAAALSFSGEARELIVAAATRANELGEGFDLELPFTSATGSKRWVRMVVEAVFAPGCSASRGDQPVHLIGAMQDVTERHLADAALREAKQAAEQASDAKSAFLANMSHEIRTPLSAVIGLSHLLQDTPLNDEQRDLLAKIQLAGRSLLGLINDVLDLARIEAGKLVIEAVPFDLNTLLESLIDLLTPLASAKQIALALTVEGAPKVPVVADAARLRQILFNLLGNAIKFTDHGRVDLKVVLTEVDTDRAMLQVDVCDTGIGIAADVQRALFRPFVQADASTTRRFGGTGLGLSITRHLVDLMGGEIGVSSQEGVGSRFWLRLPAGLQTTAAAGPAAGTLALVGPVGAAEPPAVAGLRVLVVDDSEINRDVAQRLLQRHGVDVTALGTAGEALDRLGRSPTDFDLVLMDVQMPGMDGNEAVRRLRADPRLADLPVVGLSAGALPLERQRSLEAGMIDFLTKPIEPDLLLDAVRGHARPGRGGSVPDSGPGNGAPPADESGKDTPTHWPVVAGIDGPSVALRLGHDVGFFCRLLKRLLSENTDLMAETAREPWPDSMGESLAARAHKLRGSAGMMGAVGVQACAAALEAALQSDAPATEIVQHRLRLAQALRELQGACAPLLARHDGEAAPAATAADPAATAELVDLLRRRDLAALSHFAALRPALMATPHASRLPAIQAALDTLDYQQALNLITSDIR